MKIFLTSFVHALLFYHGTCAGPASLVCFQYKYHYPRVKLQPPVLQYWEIYIPYSWMIMVKR
jgi:hypothetical protein